MPQRSSLLSLDAAASGAAAAADGAAWADYYWVDPKPHESLTIAYETLRAGTPPGWADVYIRSGEWPTTEEHDAMMSADPQLPPSPQFVLHADRLFNERIFVMVVGRGASFVDYTLTANARPSASLALVALVVALVAALMGPEAGEAKPLRHRRWGAGAEAVPSPSPELVVSRARASSRRAPVHSCVATSTSARARRFFTPGDTWRGRRRASRVGGGRRGRGEYGGGGAGGGQRSHAPRGCAPARRTVKKIVFEAC